MSHGIDVSTITPESIKPPVVARAAWPLEQDISLVGALNTVLRRAPVVFGLPLVAALLTGLVTLVVPPTYTATTTFVPEVRSQNRLPAGLAARESAGRVPQPVQHAQTAVTGAGAPPLQRGARRGGRQ